MHMMMYAGMPTATEGQGIHMVLKGVDVSHWDDNVDFRNLGVDFAICKATQGTGFTDNMFDANITGMQLAGLLTGIYHFADGQDPVSEAEFFFSMVHDHIGKSVMVLDFEIDTADNRDWCEKFIARFYELSHVWPMLYISAYRCSQYAGSFIPAECGLWVAGYPHDYQSWPDPTIPYDLSPWPFAALWQFSSALLLNGQGFDGNYAYMDVQAWQKYAGVNGQPAPAPSPAVDYLTPFARDVIAGKYGNGLERKELIYKAVQGKVNEILGA